MDAIDPTLGLTEEQRRDMVDERVCRILAALRPPGSAADDEVILASYLADEWACLEVAARIVAPALGLHELDGGRVTRLQRAAHGALKAECRRIAAEGMGPGKPGD